MKVQQRLAVFLPADVTHVHVLGTFLHFIHNADAISGTIAPPAEEQKRGYDGKKKEKKKNFFKMIHPLSPHHTASANANGRSATETAAN